MEDYRLEQTGQEVQDILNGAAMDANLQEEVERATDAEGTLQGNIDAEERARQDADGLLQQGISDEENRAKRAEEANAGEIDGIKALIPSTASEANKLADTNYVNSSIQTATAEYRGDYNVVTDLHLAIDATHAQIETLLGTVIAEADKNDYCYVMIPTSAQTPTEIAKIERYKMTSEGWKFEYDVNNSTFTAEEWAAIKSGITSGLVGKLNALPSNTDLLLLLAGKQDVLTFDSVPVPESNNPVKSGGVYSAIDDEKTARLNSDTAIHAELDGLQAKVPATASSDNKLVDQNQMNSSISTATATYRGDWNIVSDLHLAVDATRAQIAALLPTVIATADNNDYCYVEIPTNAETPTQIERVERYKFNGTAWAYEYVLNNSGFTAAQWAAINSMITSGLVEKLSALPTNADLLAMFATKQDNLTFDSTPTENSTNPVTSGGVFAADKALSDAIEAILLLIPSAASSLNKLVDTALMNSSISTATATFRGTYNLVSGLHLDIDATEGQIAAALLSTISTADNNDYAFVQIPTSAETPAQIARTDRYKFNGTAWAYEYTLNTSGFTAAQWAAINSTITSALVAKLNALPTAAELQEALGVLTSGITAINQKIPSTASQSNKLVDNASMESYIAQVINILDASFNVTSTDGHITLHITQVDGVITSVQVQSTDIASAADLTLVTNKVTTAEGNISSLTGRMGTAETNIANLQQLYNNLQQSKPVPVTALPSTGQQQGVIYRLAGTTSYSDYMWNGSSWVLMATYNNAVDDELNIYSSNLVENKAVAMPISTIDGIRYTKQPSNVDVNPIRSDIPISITIKNISCSKTSFYIQLKYQDQICGYITVDGGARSDLQWVSGISQGTSKTVNVKYLKLFLYSNRESFPYIDGFVVGTTQPITAGEIEVSVSQNGEIADINYKLDEIGKKTYIDITDSYSSTISNSCPLQIYLGDVKAVNAWYTRVYHFTEDTPVKLQQTGNALASLYKQAPAIDGECVCCYVYPENPVAEVVIPAGYYLATGYIGIQDNKVTIQKIAYNINQQPSLSVYSALDRHFNILSYNRNYLSMAKDMIDKKCVDNTNRLCVAFNGDSIFGSQLDDITHSSGYDTGVFPPNMSKQIVAKKFYDKYKFDGEDTQFRNLIHSDWVKSGFNVNQNKGISANGFNELEVYGCSSANDYAEITVTGYKYFKLIWSYWGGYDSSWSATVTVSVDGGAYVSPGEAGLSLPSTINKPVGKVTNLLYQIAELDITKTYKIRVTAGENYDKIGLWGCEYWNNPRLDVVVQALSGTTAYQNKNWMPDAYYQEGGTMFTKPHKPVLVITDILCTNDTSYIYQKVNGENIHWFLESQAYLYKLLKDNGVYILAFAPHVATANVPERSLASGARSIALNNGAALVDIPLKLAEVPPTQSIVTTDGTHLSNYGNEYYFNEIERIFDV